MHHALAMLRILKRSALWALAFTIGALVIAVLLCRGNGEAYYEC